MSLVRRIRGGLNQEKIGDSNAVISTAFPSYTPDGITNNDYDSMHY